MFEAKKEMRRLIHKAELEALVASLGKEVEFWKAECEDCLGELEADKQMIANLSSPEADPYALRNDKPSSGWYPILAYFYDLSEPVVVSQADVLARLDASHKLVGWFPLEDFNRAAKELEYKLTEEGY